MTADPNPAGAKIDPLRQFSLRSLFTLTFVAVPLLTTGVLLSPWTSIAIVAVMAVWLLHRARLIAPRRLATASIVFFGISLCLPAVSLRIMGDPAIFMGWQAFYVSFVAIPDVFREFRTSPWSNNRDIEWAFAYLAGSAANAAFLAGFLSHLFAARFSWALPFAHRAAVVAFALAFVDLALMVFSFELGAFYPGFGFWVASMLALALGTRS